MLRPRLGWLLATRGRALIRARLSASASTRKYLEPFWILASAVADSRRRLLAAALSSTGAGAKSKGFEGSCARRRALRMRAARPRSRAMTERIYLDWNASAPLRPEARAAALAAL